MPQIAGALAVLRSAGSGGGSVEKVTSSDETVIVTDPTGPDVDLSGVLPISDLVQHPVVTTYIDPTTAETSRMVVIDPLIGGGFPLLASSSEALGALLPNFLLYADGEQDWRAAGSATSTPATVSAIGDGGTPLGTALAFTGSSGSGMVFGAFDPNDNIGPAYGIAVLGPAGFVDQTGDTTALRFVAGNPNGPLGANVGDVAFDVTDYQLWYCNTAGPAGTATWVTNPITSGSLNTTTLTSGVAAVIDANRDVETHTPVTLNPNGTTAGIVTVALSPDGVTFTNLTTLVAPSVATLAGTIQDAHVRVPAGWRLRLTVNAAARATIGTTTWY